jgi:hypothetical protein
VSLELDISNVGFGKLYNPRPLQIVFAGQGGPFVVTALADCRREMPLSGETRTVPLTFNAPSTLVSGATYELHLRMPDPSDRLSNDVRYMIRLANVGVWDAANGWNNLDMSVVAQ